jgi:hypothetical protein
MMRLIRILALSCVCIAGCVIATGCISQKTIDSYGDRLKSLEEKGVPDSLLSSIRVYISQANEGKRSGNGTVTKASVDSLKTSVAAAEKWSDDLVATAKPHVDSLQKLFTGQKAGLTGMQLKEADSLLAVLDSYVKKSWYQQAQTTADYINSVMPVLLKDEAAALTVAKELPGTWIKMKKHTENGANAVEKRTVTFDKNGTFTMDEQMKGQTSQQLKEDWQFMSQGTYSIKGDTLLLNVQKEQCPREIYENLVKGKWVKNAKKPHDTTITNGSKDQFFTFDYLKDLYAKKK